MRAKDAYRTLGIAPKGTDSIRADPTPGQPPDPDETEPGLLALTEERT